MRYQNLNYKGWEYTNPGWYEYTIKGQFDTNSFEEKYMDIVKWLYESIDNCERHARWTLDLHIIHVKFRYEKDYSWFVLRWG